MIYVKHQNTISIIGYKGYKIISSTQYNVIELCYRALYLPIGLIALLFVNNYRSNHLKSTLLVLGVVCPIFYFFNISLVGSARSMPAVSSP